LSPIPPVTADEPEAKSADLVAENLAALKALFPQAFAEGGIDFETLRELLGDAVNEGDERYGLNWSGKRQARRLALTPSLGTLRPAVADSVDWKTTKNLMIEGDNLEVLKLLQKSYASQVKLIYIDPPYNTGNDFVYPDDYSDSLGNYMRRTGQADPEGNKNTSNPESSGRYHSDWLNMMLPRLMLARGLLRDDGVLFLSCDETELGNIRLMADSIFGGENHVADLVWAAGRKNDARLISISHEYIVCYVKNADRLRADGIEWRRRKGGLDAIYAHHKKLVAELGADYPAISLRMKSWFKSLPADDPAKAHSHYSSVDKTGLYFPDNISWPGGGGPKYEVLHPVTGRPVKVPSRGWMTSDPEKMARWIAEDRVHFGQDENSVPCIKAYLKDREQETPYSVFYQDGRAATKRLRDLMGDDVFDFPKDETVIAQILEMASSGEDIIVDFFAGSGTTGHAVMAQNAADGGKRRYILVQLPEPLDTANKHQKAAAEFCDSINKPRNIAELSKERLRRAAAKVKADNPNATFDGGFRAYKLATSNLKAWTPGTGTLQADIENAIDNLTPGRTEEDLMVELLLKQGIDLTEAVVTRDIGGRRVHSFGGGVLVVCLADVATADAQGLADGIAAWIEELSPATATTLFFKDSGFEDNQAKANLAAILSQRLGERLLKVRSL
jgi:adenine-specific DNA-methyltransferase